MFWLDLNKPMQRFFLVTDIFNPPTEEESFTVDPFGHKCSQKHAEKEGKKYCLGTCGQILKLLGLITSQDMYPQTWASQRAGCYYWHFQHVTLTGHCSLLLQVVTINTSMPAFSSEDVKSTACHSFSAQREQQQKLCVEIGQLHSTTTVTFPHCLTSTLLQ